MTLERVIQARKAVEEQTYFFNHQSFWFWLCFILSLAPLLYGLYRMTRKGTKEIHIIIPLAIGVISLPFAMQIGVSNFQQQLKAGYRQWETFTFRPYLQQHQASYTVQQVTCGTNGKDNTFSLTAVPRHRTLSLRVLDTKGKAHDVSGSIEVLEGKKDDKMTLKAIYLPRDVTSEWKAGYYEPVLTIPSRTHLYCPSGKM